MNDSAQIDPHEESLYNVRAAIPEHLEIFARWREWSDRCKADCPTARLDLSYGPGANETLDFFPAPSPGAPLVMFIHGGYWQALDKDDNAFAASALNAAGVSVAVVNYTLCPETTVQGIVDQMRRAALWLRANAPDLGVDSSRFFVAGHSAGGHLAAMLTTIDWPAEGADAPRDLIKGVIAISGLFDLTALVNTTINIKADLSKEDAVALSPVNHRPSARAPMILAVGGDESEGFHAQARALRDAWEPFGVPISILPLPGCHHLGAVEALADRGGSLVGATLSLIGD
ncbi:MAG: alpha/beta hydrolase [Rhodospirillales bacterium]|nr:alpha/beta hydrolase [Rhodospirillales bacterium]